MGKHTPGPWKACWNGTYHDIRVSDKEGGEDIGTYSPSIAHVIQNSFYRHTSGLEKQEANTHLIAAAPEMYEALKEIYINGACRPSYIKWITDALDKAEGGSNNGTLPELYMHGCPRCGYEPVPFEEWGEEEE